MKLILASDSFKGSISSGRAAQLLAETARKALGECETVELTVADGGEGTAEAVISACGGKRIYAGAHDPLMNPIRTYYGSLRGGEAIIEMALASGLVLVAEEERDPLVTSSYGTGELVLHAIKSGYRSITLAIGGSATNDGGMGFARALGVRFLDERGTELEGRGCDLEKVADIDTGNIIPEAAEVSFTVMSDVDNPLCGNNGATFTFGRQKGADDESLARLERGMQNYRSVIIRKFGIDPDEMPGAGAAGGLGTAMKVFFNAEMKSGIDTLLDMVKFEQIIKGADLIVTGEGRLDAQSLHGKAVKGIGDRAKKAGVPVLALCGCVGKGYEDIYKHGIVKVRTLTDDATDAREAMQRAEELYRKRAAEMFEDWKNS